jgi:predicted NBD/HSP70 family sugar kinase
MIKVNDIDRELIKDSNRKKILKLLYRKRQLTKQEISKELGLSIPTVISNINDLIREGIVDEAGVAESTGGRKPVVVRFLPDARYSFGVDISIKNVRVILTNLNSEIKFETVFDISKYKNINEITSRVCSIINNIILEGEIPIGKVLGVGISVPGTVNEEKLLIELAPNLGIESFSFDNFAKQINLPVYIENEANAAAFAELNIGIAKELSNLVYVSITEGIGTGIVIQGNLYKGENKRAGEFGHMTIEVMGNECSCGRRGCWELYASEKALLEAYFINYGERLCNLQELFNKVEKNELEALKTLDLYLNYLSIGIQNIILEIDPSYIIVGGEISNYDKILLKSLERKIFVKNKFYKEGEVKILFSKLKKYSSVLGASLLPLNSLFFISGKII